MTILNRRNFFLPAVGVAVGAGVGAAVGAGVGAAGLVMRSPVRVDAAPYMVDSVAALKALPFGASSMPAIVHTRGFATPGDGAGGPPWNWMPGSRATADDFMVVAPKNGAAGRFVRNPTSAAVRTVWAGCALGDADDTLNFLKVITYAQAHGYAIDCSGGTHYLQNYSGNTLTFYSGGLCPGMFSDGSGIIKPGPASNSNTILICVKNPQFYIDNIQFILPVSTVAKPPCDRAILMSGPTTSGTSSASTAGYQRITRCRFIGGVRGIVTDQISSKLEITNNVITNVYGQAIAVSKPFDVIISENQIEDCGYDGNLSSAAIRIGEGSFTEVVENLVISRNVITRCNQPDARKPAEHLSKLAVREQPHHHADDPRYRLCLEYRPGRNGADRQGRPDNDYRQRGDLRHGIDLGHLWDNDCRMG
jgi:hypothetical protein